MKLFCASSSFPKRTGADGFQQPKFLPPSPPPRVFPKLREAGLAFVVTDQAADCIHILPEPEKAKGQQGRGPRALVDGKQPAAVCRIKALWRLHCCGLLVHCWGGAGAPGKNIAVNPAKVSETVNCSECVPPVGGFTRLPDFRLQQSYVSFHQQRT
jgi:hypothetical protein